MALTFVAGTLGVEPEDGIQSSTDRGRWKVCVDAAAVAACNDSTNVELVEETGHPTPSAIFTFVNFRTISSGKEVHVQCTHNHKMITKLDRTKVLIGCPHMHPRSYRKSKTSTARKTADLIIHSRIKRTLWN